MKLIRDIQKNEYSRYFIPALVVLFVFSLSFHNHAIGQKVDISVDSHDYSSRSVDDCSACLLQGNLKAPESGFSLNNYYLGQIVSTISTELEVPNSNYYLVTHSRAPPTA